MREDSGGDYEVVEDGARSGGRRRPAGVVAVAALAALLAVGAAVGAVRGGLDQGSEDPAAAPSGPAAPTLERDGFGAVRFGMSYPQLARTLCAGECGDESGVFEMAQDDEHGCTLRTFRLGDGGHLTGTAWFVGDDVVSVSVSGYEGPDSPVAGYGAVGEDMPAPRTWLGPAFGDPLTVDGPVLAGAERPSGSRVPVVRVTEDSVVTTLADSDGNGRLDYAAVATPAGDACEIPPSHVTQRWGDGPLIAASSVLGATLGMTSAELAKLPGWERRREEWAPQGAVAECERSLNDAGAGAYLRDGIVVGLTAAGVDGGPRLGHTVGEATDALTASTGTLPTVIRSDDRPQVVEATTRDGVALRAYLATTATLVEHVDVLAFPSGSEIVVDVVLGDDCSGEW